MCFIISRPTPNESPNFFFNLTRLYPLLLASLPLTRFGRFGTFLNPHLPLLPILESFKSICNFKVSNRVTSLLQFLHKAKSFCWWTYCSWQTFLLRSQDFYISIFKGLKSYFHDLVTTLATCSSPRTTQPSPQPWICSSLLALAVW